MYVVNTIYSLFQLMGKAFARISLSLLSQPEAEDTSLLLLVFQEKQFTPLTQVPSS